MKAAPQGTNPFIAIGLMQAGITTLSYFRGVIALVLGVPADQVTEETLLEEYCPLMNAAILERFNVPVDFNLRWKKGDSVQVIVDQLAEYYPLDDDPVP